MAKTITLQYAGRCRDCGTELPIGSKARWYGRGRVYGIGCHADNRTPEEKRAGRRYGSTAPRRVQTGPCEDAPCCGCCGPGSGGYGDPYAYQEDPADYRD